MSNTQAICASFKKELMTGTHVLNATNPPRTVNTADAFKAALFIDTATLSSATTVYSTTGEVTAVTGYTAGGVAVTWAAPAVNGAVAYANLAANIAWTVTGTLGPSFNAVLIYNSSQGNKAVSVHTFTTQTITNGTLTLTIPANSSTTAMIRFS